MPLSDETRVAACRQQGMHARAATTPPTRALLLLGLLALSRALWLARPPPRAEHLGEAVALDVTALQGSGFRLLPGVGPVLAERLEAARLAAGGVLGLDELREVPGVGPVLLRRWTRLARAPPTAGAAPP